MAFGKCIQTCQVANDTTNLDYMQQYLDRSVKISFSDLNISNQIQRPLFIEERKNSFAGSTTTERLQKRDKEIEDLLSTLDLKLKKFLPTLKFSLLFSQPKLILPLTRMMKTLFSICF